MKKLEAEKIENLQKLTEQARSEIATLWNKCFFSADQRQEFTPGLDEHYTETLLEIHEEELAKMHASLLFLCFIFYRHCILRL